MPEEPETVLDQMRHASGLCGLFCPWCRAEAPAPQPVTERP